VVPPGLTDPSIRAGLRGGLAQQVALVGLGPVYGHGLRIGLTAAGLPCDVLRGVADVLGVLGPGAPVVVVLPHAEAAALAALEVDGQARVEAVHVLTEGSVEAYSRALRAGATSAFQDSAELEHVIQAVRGAALGCTLLPKHVARAMSRPEVGPAPRLERHERRYLRVLADGATVAGLARQSGYSEREMYRLLSGVYSRLGAANRTEALLLAERYGLLDEENP
jgi:DNA-binding NarL/FixJ family response regulator